MNTRTLTDPEIILQLRKELDAAVLSAEAKDSSTLVGAALKGAGKLDPPGATTRELVKVVGLNRRIVHEVLRDFFEGGLLRDGTPVGSRRLGTGAPYKIPTYYID